MDVERVALAGLLHDIGKFQQRTANPPSLSEEQKQLYCPTHPTSGHATHQHAAYTGHWLSEQFDDESFVRAAANHHDPETREERLIQVADRLSAGERIEDDELDRRRASESRLRSVFSTLKAGSGEARYFPLTESWAFESGFEASEEPTVAPEGSEGTDRYQTLWSNFVEATGRLNESNRYSVSTWDALLRQYTARIPSATPTQYAGSVPDVSLYDHSRTVSALAGCLATYDPEDLPSGRLENLLDFESDQPFFTLVVGDILGIQDFIYRVQSAGAARSLKGRSAFVRSLEEWVVDRVLDHFELPATCHLISAGGQFQLLLPRVAQTELADLQVELGQTLLNGTIRIPSPEGSLEIDANLGLDVVFAANSMAPSDFYRSEFRDTTETLFENLQNQKQTRWTHRAQATTHEAVFGPLDEPGTNQECGTCAREISPEEQTHRQTLQDHSDAYDLAEDECLLCYGMRRLGNELRRSVGVRYGSGDDEKLVLPDPLNEGDPVDPNDRLALMDLDRPDYPDGWLEGPQVDVWPQTSVTPIDPETGGVQTLETLADEGPGTDKIGFVRADVDSLGQILQAGFVVSGENGSTRIDSLSRYATVSRSLDDFFSGYLGHVLKQTQSESRPYLIYSGGDDLFYLGHWHQALKGMIRLQGAFESYTGGELTLSAGVDWTDPHFPLLDGAQQAAAYLEDAKQFRTAKNALTVQGITIPWEEISYYTTMFETLRSALQGNGESGVSRRLLGHLKHLIQNGSDPQRAVTKQWRWRMMYLLDRFVQGPHQSDIETIQSLLAQTDRPPEQSFDEQRFRNTLWPVRWAEFYTQ